MRMEPKILVAAPTFDKMKYCETQFLNAIKNIDYPNYDILIIDNTKDKDYFNELNKITGLKVLHDNIKEEKPILRVISSRNMILQYALDNNYDYVLMLDSDVIVPKNILKELLKDNKDIVSGLYYNYFNIDSKIKLMPVAWKYFTPEEFDELKHLGFVTEVMKITDIKHYLTEEEINTNLTIEVALPSPGCMLIKKKVFEKVKYAQLFINNQPSITGEDIYFIESARSLGFVPYCNTRIRCEHLVSEKYKKDSFGNFVHSSFY